MQSPEVQKSHPSPKRNFRPLVLATVVVVALNILDDSLPSYSSKLHFLLASLCTLWCGHVLAISFMEAPAKFSAETLPRDIAVDVGRTVFAFLNKVELALATCVILVYTRIQTGITPWECCSALFPVALLILQVVWLQPSLDKRACAIINGRPPVGMSVTHPIYVIFEVLKVVSLLTHTYLFSQRL